MYYDNFSFFYYLFLLSLHHNSKSKDIMDTLQLNAEMLRSMSIIAEDETLLRRAVKYLHKLVAEKKDPTLFTKKEFFQRIDDAKKGPSYELKEGETIEDLIERIG